MSEPTEHEVAVLLALTRAGARLTTTRTGYGVDRPSSRPLRVGRVTFDRLLAAGWVIPRGPGWMIGRAGRRAITPHVAALDAAKQVGRKVRAARVAAGLTEVATATAAGLTPAQQRQLELGRARLAASRITAVARALEVPVESLLPRGLRLSAIPARRYHRGFMPVPPTKRKEIHTN